MNYPEELLPFKYYKKITSNLTGHYICRTTPNKNLIHPNTGLLRDEVLFGNSSHECFDYSTNLIGYFQTEHKYITLIGEEKRYFREYWNFKENVKTPIFNKDFNYDKKRGLIYFLIDKIHKSIKIPYIKGTEQEAIATAIIKHTPTRSNFWHFSIRWLDKDNKVISRNKSMWKNKIIASFRAKINEIYLIKDVNFPPPIKRKHYIVWFKWVLYGLFK